ncbi:hypothetical protein [Piscinibacter sp. HJYY11]|uniref:hypothetical protein n=1 Tax=Piscinibacter sp. HJYY11 TaxID=2801333 RepID=UPI00191EF3D2|nr:hypothetical protein [Piscinibacter sp. HJYY11]MBL0731222.1 hypothetical protein [Piscinibacter sp. HJYY11]
MNPVAFEKQLSAVNPSADGLHIDALSELIEFSGVESSVEEIQRAIFSYMERHPIADLGSPGPLVHFLEKAHPNTSVNCFPLWKGCRSSTPSDGQSHPQLQTSGKHGRETDRSFALLHRAPKRICSRQKSSTRVPTGS